VGLYGTGDQTSQAPFTVQSLTNMLAQLGVTVPANVTPQLKNVAAVSVHAVLPAFVKPGQTIDITVNSIANAKSLRGGSLLVTALHGLDGQIYAIAQGNLIVSGFGVEANDGSKLTVNVPSSGRIPNGATVERAVPSQLAQGDAIILNLNSPDFTTATRLVESVNKGGGRRRRQHHRRRGRCACTRPRTSPSASPSCRRWRICRSSRRARRRASSSIRAPAPW
jgi:flagellar P-ring protein precursor FlgI